MQKKQKIMCSILVVVMSFSLLVSFLPFGVERVSAVLDPGLPVGMDCDAIFKYLVKKYGLADIKTIKYKAIFSITENGDYDDSGNPVVDTSKKDFCVPVVGKDIQLKYELAGREATSNYVITDYYNLSAFGVMPENMVGNKIMLEGIDMFNHQVSNSLSKTVKWLGVGGVSTVAGGPAVVGGTVGGFAAGAGVAAGGAGSIGTGIAAGAVGGGAITGAVLAPALSVWAIGDWIWGWDFWNDRDRQTVEKTLFFLSTNLHVPVEGRPRYVFDYEKGNLNAKGSAFSSAKYYLYFISMSPVDVEREYGKDCVAKNSGECKADSTCFWHTNIDNSESCDNRQDSTICANLKPEDCGTENGSQVCKVAGGACIVEGGVNSLLSQYKKPDGYEGPLPDCAFDGSCDNINDLLQLLINAGAKAALPVIGGFAFIMFVYGGFMMVTSFGSAERVKKGQQVLVAAVIGMIITISAYLVISFMLDVVGVKETFRGIK